VEICGRAVVIAAGPWTASLSGADPTHLPHAFALNVEVGRRLADVAAGVRARTGAAEDPVMGGRRFLFLAPQERTTLLGTWYAPAAGGNEAELVARGAAALLAEFRAACPALELSAADVVGYQWGWLPLKAGRERGRPDALADRPRVLEHRAVGGMRDMFSVEGVKFTTARGVAEDVTDRVVAALGQAPVPCRTAETRVDEVDVLDATLEARVRRAVREEMALRLPDVLRRTSPGPYTGAGHDLEAVARLAAAELAWTDQRKDAEINAVKRNMRTPSAIPEPVA
jgi:glycerol-3-phosphate dehydrogenase